MKKISLFVFIVVVFIACKPSAPTTVDKKGPLEPLSFFIGRWTQVEGPELISYEDWTRGTDSSWTGKSWTMYQADTVFYEKIELKAEGKDIFYIPTIDENAGPVRFKMTGLKDKSVVFENPEHDFPQKITYEARGDSMLFATISGSKDGQEAKKEFPLMKVVK
jgi:hypothetical protein